MLRQVEVRNIVRDALCHFDGERYFLHDWVIMPNHVHVLLTLREGHDLSRVLHSIKSFSAKKINGLLGRSGQVWQKESFDHIVRSAESFVRLRGYVADNPRRLADGEFTLGQEVVGWDEESLTRRDAASTYEPASVLLARILAERRRRWEEAELAKMTAKGKAPKDDKWKAKYVEPVAPDTSELPKLPEGWCWTTLDSLLVNIEAGKNFKCDERPPEADEVGVVKVSAVTWGTFDEDESKTCRRGDQLRTEHLIRPGDFLISRANTIELVGACVLVGNVRRRLMLSDKILRLQLVEPWARWLLWALRSRWGRNEIERLATGNQESMRNISQVSMRGIRVPFPPATEADRILGAINTALEMADSVARSTEGNTARCARLRQSILKWAFEGRLVDQDPTDEPASVLLERIRAERASATDTAPRRARRAHARAQKS